MTPLQKCRKAKNLSLQNVSSLLHPLSGSSITTLSRIEAGRVEKISKKLTNALVNIFKSFGLTENHILEPELYPDFKANYSPMEAKDHCQGVDEIFNEQAVLLNLTKDWIENTTVTLTKFAAELCKKLGEDNLVTAEPTDTDEFSTWKSSALKRVSRILEGEAPLPLSWKHYWLSCLPENIKQIALNQMMANSGYMLVPLPKTHKIKTNDTRAKIDEISRQFADVISGSKPAMDGAYDQRDDAIELQLLQDKLAELIASCLRESTVIESCTGVTSKLQQIWSMSPLNR